jgi:hypothetical protein
MVEQGRVDGIVDARPGHRGEKFGKNKADGGLFDMLAEGPGAEGKNLLNGLVRTVESGGVLEQKILCLGIGDKLGISLVIKGIEPFKICPVIHGAFSPVLLFATRIAHRV